MAARTLNKLYALPIGLLLLFSSAAAAYTEEECLGCHSRGGLSRLMISPTEFRNSAHGKDLKCLDCHTGVRDEAHQTRPGSRAVRCGSCHDQGNLHGGAAVGRPRPRCHDCHTRHGILPKTDRRSSVHAERLPATCKSCHYRECGERDYWSRLVGLRIKSHKKQDFSRAYQDTNCLGCHQGQAAHGEQGLLNNQTCFKCHQPVQGQGPLWGSVHPRADRKSALFAAAMADQAGLGLLAIGAVLVIGRKVVQTRRKRR
ncbi:MAG: hypothetical protein MUF69_09600 [Desulfobacterota bacterium]|nr:hypothetical protein [Thermodesulfobacteriota bacterium]